MIVPQTFTCDVCGKRRDDDVNNWLVISMSLSFVATIWTRPENYAYHVCGFDHATQLFAKWMQEQKGK